MSIKSYCGALGAAIATLLLAGTASASTQGSLGTSSTGSISIQASVPGRVRISGLDDVNFLNVDPAAGVSNAQDVCVWSNTSTRGYNITALGNGTGNAFTLASGALPTVPYSVRWNASAGQASGTLLGVNTQLIGQVSTATNSGCTSGPAGSASLIVSIDAAALDSMTANETYTGTLTLVVAPE